MSDKEKLPHPMEAIEKIARYYSKSLELDAFNLTGDEHVAIMIVVNENNERVLSADIPPVQCRMILKQLTKQLSAHISKHQRQSAHNKVYSH